MNTNKGNNRARLLQKRATTPVLKANSIGSEIKREQNFFSKKSSIPNGYILDKQITVESRTRN